MAGRRKIGLIFSYSEEWIAGSYYILNIINALKILPEGAQPEITIVSDVRSNFEIVQKETAYPHLKYVETPIQNPSYNSFELFLNKIAYTFFKGKWIRKKPLRADIQFLYPFEADVSFDSLKKVNWVPDFQEMHLPHLFSSELIAERKQHQKEVVCKGDWVVFSSKDSQKDFNILYPEASVKQYVLPFAVTHPPFGHLSISELIEQYQLPEKYYFAPNQFWAHKNHLVILKAIHRLKDEGTEIHIAFSGKENDHRNADYVAQLKNYIADSDLHSNISFLGFIPREDQLQLMKHAVAIVQPSKFEGWSTVVEDAKALGQFLVLSSLGVHEEQISKNAHFFDADDDETLSAILNKYWVEKPKLEMIDYEAEKCNFAENFMKFVGQASIRKT